MNERDKLVLIKGEDKTKDMHSLRYDGGKYFIKFKGTDREYGYAYSNVEVKKANIIYELKNNNRISLINILNVSVKLPS
ncbi:MAG: hypothetical protein ACRC1T_13310 [Clostridium chrysemydis]|uniref:hypothetical protein n=1 Tax=Clostridium chrysemydis TaxID=2665504 RepID=UPI003F37FD1F